MQRKPRKAAQWNPAISVKPRVYETIKARAEALGVPMAAIVEQLVLAAICSVCRRAAVCEPGSVHCGADACAYEARAS